MVCYPTFGGSGVVATELGLELSKRGHEIHFITYNQPVRLDLLSNNVHYHEVTVPEYPLFHYQPYELALSSKLVDMVKLHKIEILHVHYAIPHAYAAYMAKKMLIEEDIYVPIVTTLHGTDITLVGSHPFYKPAVTFSINKSDAVTAVSQSLKQDTLRLFDIKNDISVVPNFIDLEKYKHSFTDCKRGMMANDSEKIITHKLLCAKLGITHKVIFFGRSNEIDKILCFSDLFLLPSLTESFGLAALEAMASGVPVISSNTGGIPEVNVEGVSGYLSEVGDVEEMSKNAIHILKDEDRLVQFKNNARQEALKFDLHEIVPQYEVIYQQTLAKALLL